MIEEASKKHRENNGVIEKFFKIPAIFLKRVLGEHYTNLKNVEKEFHVKLHFNRIHITDDCYPIHFLTTIILKGSSENIIEAHKYIKERLKVLVARRKYMSRADIKIVIGRLVQIKREIGSTEIRCCRDNALRDINNPLYTIYYKDKEVSFIGTNEETRKAELRVIEIIASSRRTYDIPTSLNYLIPVCEKNQLLGIKNKCEKNFPSSKMIVYDPLHPRKSVSLTLSSTYEKHADFLNYVVKQIQTNNLAPLEFDNYQIKASEVLIKQFLVQILNMKLTKAFNYMKSWDLLTTELNPEAHVYSSYIKILKNEISKNFEFQFLIYSLRILNESKQQNLLKSEKKELLFIIYEILIKKYEQERYIEKTYNKNKSKRERKRSYDSHSSYEFQNKNEETYNKNKSYSRI